MMTKRCPMGNDRAVSNEYIPWLTVRSLAQSRSFWLPASKHGPCRSYGGHQPMAVPWNPRAGTASWLSPRGPVPALRTSRAPCPAQRCPSPAHRPRPGVQGELRSPWCWAWHPGRHDHPSRSKCGSCGHRCGRNLLG